MAEHDFYALPRYDEVASVLRQPKRFTNTRGFSLGVGTCGVAHAAFQILQFDDRVDARRAGSQMPAVWQTFPLNLVWSFAAASFSYYLIERPFLRMRSRFRRHAPVAKETSARP